MKDACYTILFSLFLWRHSTIFHTPECIPSRITIITSPIYRMSSFVRLERWGPVNGAIAGKHRNSFPGVLGSIFFHCSSIVPRSFSVLHPLGSHLTTADFQTFDSSKSRPARIHGEVTNSQSHWGRILFPSPSDPFGFANLSCLY